MISTKQAIGNRDQLRRMVASGDRATAIADMLHVLREFGALVTVRAEVGTDTRLIESKDPGFLECVESTLSRELALEVEKAGLVHCEQRRCADHITHLSATLTVVQKSAVPWHTDLMIAPEGLEEFLERNPPPEC